MVSSRRTNLELILNPLVTAEQLLTFENSDKQDVYSKRYATNLLTQAAGVLLRLPQEAIATAIVLLQRYEVCSGPKIASDYHARGSISAAAIHLAAKNSFTPLSTKSVVNVYACLTSKEASPLQFIRLQGQQNQPPDPQSYYVTEGDHERERLKILRVESELLAAVGFDVHVALPHTLALTYLSALGVGDEPELALKVFQHLNGALLSPQLLYLTHQPNVLATAAIYLAAREVGVKLVESINWWEVFDVDREGLGFCVMAMSTLIKFAEAEKSRWEKSGFPLG